MNSLRTICSDELVYSSLIEMEELYALGLNTILNKPQPYLNIVFKASLFLGHSSESGYEVLLWWAIYTDWGKLGTIPTSPQKISLGWKTRTRTGELEEWSTKTRRMRAENGTYSTLIGEKNVGLRMLNHLLRKESTISDDECFLVEMLRQSHRSLGLN